MTDEKIQNDFSLYRFTFISLTFNRPVFSVATRGSFYWFSDISVRLQLYMCDDVCWSVIVTWACTCCVQLCTARLATWRTTTNIKHLKPTSTSSTNISEITAQQSLLQLLSPLLLCRSADYWVKFLRQRFDSFYSSSKLCVKWYFTILRRRELLREMFIFRWCRNDCEATNQLLVLYSGIFQCVCLQCFDAIGWAGKGIRPVKTEWWYTGMVICLERGANDMHMVQLMPLPSHLSLQ